MINEETHKALVFCINRMAKLEEKAELLQKELDEVNNLKEKVEELESQNEKLRVLSEELTQSVERYSDWWYEAEKQLEEFEDNGYLIEQTTPKSSSDDKLETVSSNTDGE